MINTRFIDYAIDISLRHITLAIDILHIAILISHYILLLITPLLYAIIAITAITPAIIAISLLIIDIDIDIDIDIIFIDINIS
jgi:hypothetical protein